ncbi:alpha-1 2-mannosidase [Bacteroidia bacterium]|nr:alpha-1 2-mannosidase [Bacteroidia bacterium]
MEFSVSAKEKEWVDYVNPLIGTTLEPNGRPNGGTMPAVGSPFAMTNFLPQTRENQTGAMPYAYEDTTIIGFMASHQPNPWQGDYGYMSVMPQTGKLRPLPEDRKLAFSHTREKATPYLYSVEMDAENHRKIKGEITATSRCALMRFTYPKSETAHLIIQGINLNPAITNRRNDYRSRLEQLRGWIKIDPERREISGYNPDRFSSHLGPELKNFKGYFVIQLDRPFEAYGTWDHSDISAGSTERTGTRAGAYITFPTKSGECMLVKIATSFISVEQARENMEKEIPSWDFQSVANATKQQWNEKLAKLTIDKTTDDHKTVFYTALYHCYQFPREFSEYGRYYSAFDDTIHNGVSYNDFSLWDTFRAFHPLMTFLEPELTGNWITSLLQMYREGGWMPKWPNPAYTNMMIGTHADAVIADAYMKGLRNYDVNLAYEAMRKNAMTPPDCDTQDRHTPIQNWTSYEARAGLSFYHSLGYVPLDHSEEGVSCTLEYAYDDWCVAQLAKSLGKTEDEHHLRLWADNYKYLFHKESGFMLPRTYDGEWIMLNDEDRTGFTEGDKWTYLFCVLQDIPGLIELMGGKQAFEDKLDRNFNENHYRHDNEPGHHYIYLYDYCNQPRKAQELIRKYTRNNYRNAPDGLEGNDDCGQMSAWYLFSCMGFYPVTPGSNEFAVGAPQFPVIRMKLQHQGTEKILTIKANHFSEENKYVQSVTIDGKPSGKWFFSYDEIMNAKEIVFEMTR